MLGVSREFANKQLKVWRTAGIAELGQPTMAMRGIRAIEQLVGGARTTAGTRAPLA